MAYDYNYFLKAQEENSKKYLNDQLGLINASAAKQNAAAKTLYEGKIADVDSQYADEERRIAVQKFINEQEVEETMANMGLTDSGLNRTQQTAIQLSANNNMAKLQRQKQSMVDSLKREMTAALSDIETNRLSSESTLRQSVNNSNVSAAQTAYKSYLDQQEAIEKERIKAEKEWLEKQQQNSLKVSQNLKNGATGLTSSNSYIITTSGGTLNADYIGKLSDNDIDVIYGEDNVTYVDNNSGKKSSFPYGVNPYTGTNNLRENSPQYYAAFNYGVYDNGYQPKGVEDHGKFTGYVGTDVINGSERKVWQTPDGAYWIWDEGRNKYLEYDINGE